MADLILHHFAASPFSEKVRLVLGYKQLAWRSVAVPNILPKPDVVALTGGYRRTPFLQIGADIYCDTALICDVLEQLQPAPSLYPEPGQSLARILAQWADSTLFWAAVTYNRGALAELPPAVFEDRKAMGFDVEWLRPADATPPYKAYLRRLSDLLGDQPFLLGQTPCIADFSAYHALWLAHVRGPAPVSLPLNAPGLERWLDRMRAIGHGGVEPLDATQAIATAAKSELAPPGQNFLPDVRLQDEHGIVIGSRVIIAAESFGREPTEGELIAATGTHYSLRRTDDRAGTVHVHFPRIGYVLKTA
jgi:glutathione S-transferase